MGALGPRREVRRIGLIHRTVAYAGTAAAATTMENASATVRNLDAVGDDYQALRALEDPDGAIASLRAVLGTTDAEGRGTAAAELRDTLGALGVTARDGVDPRMVTVARDVTRDPEAYRSVERGAADARLSRMIIVPR